jgi:hypothetical protein
MSRLQNNICVPYYRLKTPDIYICEGECCNHGRKLQAFSPKKKGSSSSKPSTSSRRHSVYEFTRSMEEDTVPPRRNHTLLLGGMRATRNSFMRFTKPRGQMEEPPVRPRHSRRSYAPPPYAPRYSEGYVIMTEEEEKKLARLE